MRAAKICLHYSFPLCRKGCLDSFGSISKGILRYRSAGKREAEKELICRQFIFFERREYSMLPLFFNIVKKGKKLFFHLLRRNQAGGFTLVELIIVVAIIGLIAVATIVAIRRGNSEASLRFAAQNLVSVLEQARTMTLSGKVPAGEAKPPAGGYGVSITVDDAFVLFADQNDNLEYNPASDQLIETITLPPEIKFTSLGATVIFNPPDGEIKTGINDQTITLQNIKSSRTEQVWVQAATGEIMILEL